MCSFKNVTDSRRTYIEEYIFILYIFTLIFWSMFVWGATEKENLYKILKVKKTQSELAKVKTSCFSKILYQKFKKINSLFMVNSIHIKYCHVGKE